MSVHTEQALWYSSRAKLQLREAEKHFRRYRYSECVLNSQESIEFSLKAIFEFLGEQYPREHDVFAKNSSELLRKISNKLPNRTAEISRALLISERWSKRARELARYGEQILKVPGTRILTKKDAEHAKADASELCDLLQNIEKEIKFSYPIKLGILNGYVEGPETGEKPCTDYPWVDFRIEAWKNYFSDILVDGKNKYEVEEIHASQISNKFGVIINPFGEAYPEKDLKERVVFDIIKDYIWDGGIFVNVAGFAFFYAWDVNSGKKQPILDEKIYLPATIELNKGQVIIDRFQIFLPFSGSLLWREFNARTTGDTPTHSGPFPLEVFQSDVDKQIAGDLIDVGGSRKIQEFRALTKETENCIPLLRASRPDFGEVYPIGAIKYGKGYLIVAGMNMTGEAEFKKLVRAIDAFCDWVKKSSRE